jgi:hypothetical protein
LNAITVTGTDLEFAFNGLTARLVNKATGPFADLPQTCTTQTNDRIFVDGNPNNAKRESYHNAAGDAQGCEVVIVNGDTELPAFLNGDQMDWKKDANHAWRPHTSQSEASDCSVTIYDKCAVDGIFPDDENYSGPAATMKQYFAGHYGHLDIHGHTGSMNVAAVKVEGDCKLRMYNEKYFGGEEREIRTSQLCMQATDLKTEFESQVYSHMIVDGKFEQEALIHSGDGMKWDEELYKKHGLSHTKQRLAENQWSLRVNSLELVHYSHPTPYPTAFPTSEPTFHMDMPTCPLYCTYQNDHHDSTWDVNKGHLLHVIHNRSAMPAWTEFRATYGTSALTGKHSCWHEQPAARGDEQWDDESTKHNHADYFDHEGDLTHGGCHCRCM